MEMDNCPKSNTDIVKRSQVEIFLNFIYFYKHWLLLEREKPTVIVMTYTVQQTKMWTASSVALTLSKMTVTVDREEVFCILYALWPFS